MTAIAGHVDGPALEVVSLGLRDPAAEVQRAALMRLLTFPPEKALPLIQNYTERTSGTLREVAQAGRAEIEGRQLFPFLRGGSAASQVSAIESVFPSRNGTVPVVSPDGQWVAYVETGWGRPGGSGGTGRSNLLSLIHAVRADGTDDRLVSDMFLVGWLSDSRRIASARDGFAAICDLRGNVVSEFGQQLEEKWLKQYASRGDWRKGDPHEQMGEEMPHQKRLSGLDKFDFGEDAAFSTDGKWYGPLRQNGDMVFISASGQISKMRPAEGLATRWQQASWSPDGKYVSLMGIHDDNALVIDVQDRTSQLIKGVDVIPNIESWAYRKGRWNPWSKDGGRLTFLRKGQVWVSKPDGTDAKQLTFDSSRKAFPTFSRGGRSIAYLSWQPDDRMHYTRVGPTDLWAVDVETGLATRVTAPSPGRIHSFEWLDDYTLIFDRLDPKGGVGYRSTLRRVSLL
jgi:hypothetical protein